MRAPAIVRSVVSLAAVAESYRRWVRPWQLTWGSTHDEVARSMPGDDVVAAPSFNATRAVSIQAPPDCIYPWLVQMGVGRAGWYSYDLLDNLARSSARTILPQHQRIEVGDVVPMSPDGQQGMKVHSINAPQSMVWGEPGGTTWAWQLDEAAPGSTRLITRVRSRYRWLSPSIAFSVLVEFGDIWMMRKMLLNLRERASSLP